MIKYIFWGSCMDNKIHYICLKLSITWMIKYKCLCACGVTDTGAENRWKMLCQNFLSPWFLFVSGWSVQTSNLCVGVWRIHSSPSCRSSLYSCCSSLQISPTQDLRLKPEDNTEPSSSFSTCGDCCCIASLLLFPLNSYCKTGKF